MSRGRKRRIARLGAEGAGAWLLVIAFCVGITLTGCWKQNAQGPLAPELRGPVKDLAAIRIGDEISLSWTVPKSGTGRLVVNGLIKVEVCRRETASKPCTEAREPLLLARGATGSFSEKLPMALASGNPRLLYYFVELLNRNGRSTGLSNRVVTLAGAPPPPVRDLIAEMTPNGVLLRWKPGVAGDSEGRTEVRICRWEVIQTPATEAVRENPAPFPSTPEKDLTVEDDAGQALDRDVRNGSTYNYTAQRVFRIAIGAQTVELDGQLSPHVLINTASETHVIRKVPE